MRHALLGLALVLSANVAHAYVPVPDSWVEDIYVLDGNDVCVPPLSIDEDDQATCDTLRPPGVLNHAYGEYLSDRMGGDLIDTLIVLSDFDQQLGDALAFYSGLCNDIDGTGRSGGPCGGQNLSGVIDMNASDKFPADYNAGYSGPFSFFDVLGQEVEHQVGAFLTLSDTDLIGRQGAHWSFFMHTEGSVMEGNKWRDDGNGTFVAVDIDGGFHAIDQYLWGFRAPEEVPPLFVIEPDYDLAAGDTYPIQPATVRGVDAESCTIDSDCPPGTFRQVCVRQACTIAAECDEGAACAPGDYGNECQTADGTCQYLLNDSFGARSGTTVRGTRVDFTIDDLIARYDPRDPSFFEGEKFTREWFVWYTRPGEVTPETSACLEGRFDRVVRMRQEWSKYFYEQTDFRGRVLTTEDLVEDLPLWEWGLVSEGYSGGTLLAEDALERWTAGGSHTDASMQVLARDPLSCATDLDCDDGQRCIRRGCQGTDRYLHLETSGGDAYIDSPRVRFHAADYNTLRVTMDANQGGAAGTFWWQTSGESDFSAGHSKGFAISGDGERRIHTVLLLAEDGWSDDIQRMRITPGDGAGNFDVDRVELVKEEIQMYCVGAEDASCDACGPGLQCRGGACLPPIPCAEPGSCVMPASPTPCIPDCEEGWACVDGACQIPKACDEPCDCGEDGATCDEESNPCPAGWACEVSPPDRDGDGFLDEEDNCRDMPNPDQVDGDEDGVGDDCQDLDGDGVANADDNCPSVTNSRQGDEDHDGAGDVCDGDFEYDVGCTCRTGGAPQGGLWLLLALVPLCLRRRTR